VFMEGLTKKDPPIFPRRSPNPPFAPGSPGPALMLRHLSLGPVSSFMFSSRASRFILFPFFFVGRQFSAFGSRDIMVVKRRETTDLVFDFTPSVFFLVSLAAFQGRFQQRTRFLPPSLLACYPLPLVHFTPPSGMLLVAYVFCFY